jgi:hypothetical protein
LPLPKSNLKLVLAACAKSVAGKVNHSKKQKQGNKILRVDFIMMNINLPGYLVAQNWGMVYNR